MQIHRSHGLVNLGPLVSAMAEGAAWFGQDEFPSSQVWADETERVLAFIDSRVGLDRCLGDLRASASQRDSALTELRVAFYLRRPCAIGRSGGIWWLRSLGKCRQPYRPPQALPVYQRNRSIVYFQIREMPLLVSGE